MKEMNNEEMTEVEGGLLKTCGGAIAAGIGAFITFAIGVISGWVRPYPCSSQK